MQSLVADILEKAGVAYCDRGLAREAAQPISEIRRGGQSLGTLENVRDNETNRFSLDDDRDGRDGLAPELVHQLRQRDTLGRAAPVPHANHHVFGSDLCDGNIHGPQSELGRSREPVRCYDAAR